MPTFTVGVTATTNGTASFTYPSQSSSPITTTPGLNVIFLDCHNGDLISFKTFDILSDPSSWDKFASTIEADTLFPNTYVLIAIQQGRAGVVSNVTDRARRAVHLLGGTGFRNVDLSKITTWGFVGQYGAGIATSLERFSFETSPVQLSVELTKMAPSCRTHVISATSNGTGFISAWILYDNAGVVRFGSDGLNVVVIDPVSATVQQVSSFGPSPSDGDAFADLVQSKPENWIFAVSFKAFTPSLLTPPVKATLESIGSNVVLGAVSAGMSWVLIGSRAYSVSGVSEVSSMGPSSQTSYYFDTNLPKEIQSSFTLQCRGTYNNNLDVVIDGCVLESAKMDPAHSFRIAALSSYSGIVCGYRAFDITNSSDQRSLAEFIEQIPPGYWIVAIYQPPNGFTFPAPLSKLLSSISPLPIQRVPSSNIFGLLSCKGSGPARSFYRNISQSGTGWNSADTFALTCQVFLSQRPPMLLVEAFSAGYFAGNRAGVTVNMRTVAFSQANRGLNTVIFNGYGTVVNIASFDTHSDPTAADRFASLIEGLPAGTNMAVVIVDEATNCLNNRAIQSIRSLGGSKLASVAYRGSYTLIGCKGRPIDCVSEAFSPSGPNGVLVKSYVPNTEPSANHKGNWISVSTSSSTNNNHILLNGAKVSPITTFGPGIQVLAVGPDFLVVNEVLDDNIQGLLEDMRADASDSDTVYAIYVPPSRTSPTAAVLGDVLGSINSDGIVADNSKGTLLVGTPGGGSGSALELRFGPSEVASISFWAGQICPVPSTGQLRARRTKRFLLVLGGVVVYFALFRQLEKDTEGYYAISGPIVSDLTVPAGVTTLTPIDPPPKQSSSVVRRGLFVSVDNCGEKLAVDAFDNVDKMRTFYSNKAGYMQSTVFLNDRPETPPELWPTITNVRQHLNQLIQATKDGEVALFHIFSHGLVTGPLLPKVKPSINVNPECDSLSCKDLQKMIANLSPRVNFTFFFCCCHSGRWLGPSEHVPHGIAFACAKEDDRLKLWSGIPSNPTSLLKSILGRSRERKPFPTYEALRKEIQTRLNDELKNKLENLRNEDGTQKLKDGANYMLLQYNPNITDPNRLIWLESLS